MPAFLEPSKAAHLQEALNNLRASLRPGQQAMADWQGGALAVSAVPGSGKSTGMAIAATILLAKRYLQQQTGEPGGAQGQLVLVTFTRSAAANLKAKIRSYLTSLGLAPQGFAVYTLHGLALNIATRHPELSGLSLERATLVSPTQSSRLTRTCVEQWISANPQTYFRLIEGRQFDGEETERLRRQSVLRTEVLPELAHTVIHEAKSSGLTPDQLRHLSATTTQRLAEDVGVEDYDGMAIAAGLYDAYERLLHQRGLIDYDDMILAALRVLEDAAIRRLWQAQVFAVFEDEAQDSSPLQTRLLEILAETSGKEARSINLVRVGDPNQAINSTFTPADPLFFRQFCEQCQAAGRLAQMDQAGRSSPIILEAANFLLDWVNRRYGTLPNSEEGAYSSSRGAQPFRPQPIYPVAAHDPQPDANPLPEGRGLEIRYPRDPHHTVELIGRRVAQVLTRDPEARAAVLVRENRQGRFVAEVLRNPSVHGIEVNLGKLGIEVYDVGQRDRHSHVPAEMLTLLQFLDRPHSPDHLKAALRVLVDRQLIPTQDLNALVTAPEQFLYPGPLDPPHSEPALHAQRYCTSLLHARLELPYYQLISFLALALRYDQTELATADKLAARVTQQIATNQSMGAILSTLGEIVQSDRFEPVETDNPETRYVRANQLTIITMHKAKGLDWDFVFIPFLHEDSIPGRLWVPPQAQFLGDFNLADVVRAQIRAHIHRAAIPTTDIAWKQASYLQTAEEFRLLYVAMTRARRLLWMSASQTAPYTWNKPENLNEKIACPALLALSNQFPQSGASASH